MDETFIPQILSEFVLSFTDILFINVFSYSSISDHGLSGGTNTDTNMIHYLWLL